MNKNDGLSIGRFKDVDISTLSDAEFRDFVLAKLMQTIMQRLEVCILSDRIFSRTRYDVMAAFWAAKEQLDVRDALSDNENS